MQVRDVLGRKDRADVVTISESQTLGDLCRLLDENRIGAVIATDATGGLIGVISERDVVRAIAASGPDALVAPVAAHMTREVQTAAPEESVVSILGRMTAGRFRHMPVIESGAVIGVVSIGDLVKVRIEALERENDALETFIRS